MAIDYPPSPLAHLPRKRADAERNLARIVDAASAVIAAHPEATIAEIAEASGLGRATIYRHFASREELLSAICRHSLREVGLVLQQSIEAGGTIAEVLLRSSSTGLSLPDRGLCTLADGLPPALREAMVPRSEVVEALEPLAGLLDRARAAGELRRDLPVEWQFQALLALYKAAACACACGAASPDAAAELLVTTFLDGNRVGAPATPTPA